MRYSLILAIVLLCTDVLAANHYIRQGATGTGTGNDWTNACTDFSGSCNTQTRGDTYYVADGTYACRTFSTAVSGTTPVIIKKAIVSDHGTSTGWSDTFGDGQATFSSSGADCLDFSTNYWTLDGQVGGGPGSWTSGHGFKLQAAINNGSGTTTLLFLNNQFGQTRTGITIAHVAAGRTNFNGSNICDSPGQCPAIVYAIGLTNSSFSYVYFHDTDSFAAMRGVSWDTVTIQYSAFQTINRKEVLACSGNCTNLTVRWNYFKDVAGTGHLVATTSGDTDPITNWFIYGNIFYNSSSAWFLNDCIICTNVGHGQSSSNVLIYNNTLVNMYGMGSGTFVLENCTGCQGKNNLFYTTTGYDYGYSTGFTKDFDWCNPSADCANIAAETNDQAGAGNPFTNLSGEDFTLAANTTAGANLGAPYNVDMFGTTRTTWTRGALEFGSGSGDTTPPAGPTGVYISQGGF
jgi:hypothetical protein